MSLLYLLLLCFAGTNAESLKDALSDIVSNIGNLNTKGLSLHGSLDLSPKLTVSTPDLGLSASLSSGHEWLSALRSHIKNKVANLHAALKEIENAHSNLNTAAVPVAVTSNISPVLVPVEHQEVSPVTVSVEHQAPPVTVVEHHDLTPLQVNVQHEPAPVKVVEEQNLVPALVKVEAEPKVDTVDISKSEAHAGVLSEGGNNLGLASNLKLHLPHLNIGGDISFDGKGYLNDIANLGKDLKAKLNKLNPLHALEGLVSDSENKLNKLKAMVNLHNFKLGANEGLVNDLCLVYPSLCSDETSLGLLLKPKKASVNLDLNSGLASLLESLKGKGLSQDGDRLVAKYQSVPVAQAAPPQPVAVSQPIPVQQHVAVSQPVPVAHSVTVTQDVPVNQYSVGIPVSVRVPEFHSIPVSQPEVVSQAVPSVSQYSVGVPVSQYNVGFPVSVRIPELHSVPVSQESVNVGIPLNLAGSLQGSLGGLSGGFEASLGNGEQHNGVLVSSGSPLYTYNGALPHEEVRVDGEYSRRSGSVRRPSVYDARRGMQRAPIPMAGVNYGRRM